MAHSLEIRSKAKSLYVRNRLSMEQVATQLGVAFTTIKRWRADALEKGDDWDSLRSAVILAGGDADEMARQVSVEMMVQFQSVLGLLQTQEGISAVERAKILASLGDSMSKAMAFIGRAMPEESKLAAAMQTLNKLAEFIRKNFPQHLTAFASILQPFGETLPEIFKEQK